MIVQYPKTFEGKLIYALYPVSKNGKWRAADVLVQGGYLDPFNNPMRMEVSSYEKCSYSCDKINKFNGFTPEECDLIMSMSMGLQKVESILTFNGNSTICSPDEFDQFLLENQIEDPYASESFKLIRFTRDFTRPIDKETPFSREQITDVLTKVGINWEFEPDESYQRCIKFSVYGIKYKIIWLINESTLYIGEGDRAPQVTFRYLEFNRTYQLFQENKSLVFHYYKYVSTGLFTSPYEHHAFRIPLELTERS